MYVELSGPSSTDVHHNFVQRWNMATERAVAGGHWACDAADDLPVPSGVAAARGTSTVQIARMLPAFGERSVIEQYKLAIDAARRTIYIENQAIPIMEVAAPLLRAMERGVEVILLVPSTPEKYVFDARLNPAERSRFEGVEALAGHRNFMMAGLGPTYVHNKTMIVDYCWATIGSCNLHAFSLQGHAEMNAGIWDADLAGALRRRLFAKHLGVDVSGLDDRAAFALYRQAAQEGRGVYILDPHRYGVT
jgi:phosphatidylserine/phosphatidylglycerophosphate/cardiolipin synthase-like enzyme